MIMTRRIGILLLVFVAGAACLGFGVVAFSECVSAPLPQTSSICVSYAFRCPPTDGCQSIGFSVSCGLTGPSYNHVKIADRIYRGACQQFSNPNPWCWKCKEKCWTDKYDAPPGAQDPCADQYLSCPVWVATQEYLCP